MMIDILMSWRFSGEWYGGMDGEGEGGSMWREPLAD